MPTIIARDGRSLLVAALATALTLYVLVEVNMPLLPPLAELAVFGDFLNLTNSDANESVLDRRLGNANYLVESRFILPRRLMVGGKFRF